MSMCMAGLFISCGKDTSVYEAQKKEDVASATHFEPDGDDNPEGGALKRGVHKVALNVTLLDGSIVKREFKYYMPNSVDESKPVPLTFNFHGSYTYDEGITPPDPILSISPNHILNRIADSTNMIVIWPAGIAETGAVNWQNTDKNLSFVEAMLTFFEQKVPSVDQKRIYACGHSSGAIFSFVLAYNMSERFAAVCPVSGQMRLPTAVVQPGYKTAIRAFNGEKDETVNYTATQTNIKAWAERIGGYKINKGMPAPVVLKQGRYNIDAYKWNGGDVDIELFGVLGEGHGVDWFEIMPLMWEFMRSHPKK